MLILVWYKQRAPKLPADPRGVPRPAANPPGKPTLAIPLPAVPSTPKRLSEPPSSGDASPHTDSPDTSDLSSVDAVPSGTVSETESTSGREEEDVQECQNRICSELSLPSVTAEDVTAARGRMPSSRHLTWHLQGQPPGDGGGEVPEERHITGREVRTRRARGLEYNIIVM
jgi:hypothetical protein